MIEIRVLIRPFQASELKTLGKILFVLGVGGLSFSGTCLLAFKDFCSEQPTAIFLILLSSLGLLLAGETIIAFSHPLTPPAAGPQRLLRWLAEPVTKPKRHRGRHCSFCGTHFILPTVSNNGGEAEERDFDRLLFGVCLGCGKTVCPGCAFIKGFDMKLKSLHCPGCGSLVL